MTDATKTLAIGRDLVSPELFGKLAGRIARTAHLDYEFAEWFIENGNCAASGPDGNDPGAR